MKLTYGLGTIGFRHGDFYADMFRKPYWGVFINDGNFRRWYNLRGELLKVSISNPVNACRIARRTMKPWAIVKNLLREDVELVSYPFIDDHGFVRVMARSEVGHPGSLFPANVEHLRPWNFARRTGIPAQDPI